MPSRTADMRRALNRAYQLRLKYSWRQACFDPFLPLSVEKQLFCCRFETFCRMSGMELEELLASGVSRDGFTVRHNGRAVIVYNERSPRTRQRFTLAHELGHIILGHEDDGPGSDAEADCFARNLLMPVLYARKAGADFRHYPALFDVSPTAAAMARRFYEEDAAGIWPSTRKKVSMLLD